MSAEPGRDLREDIERVAIAISEGSTPNSRTGNWGNVTDSGKDWFRRIAGEVLDTMVERGWRAPTARCIDCGKPRSIGSAERCRACYQARAKERVTMREGLL